jgi:hypothetical protein
VIGQEVKDPYRYSVTFVDKDSRKIEVPEETSRRRRSSSANLSKQDLEVAIIPAGEFGAEALISKIASPCATATRPTNPTSTRSLFSTTRRKTSSGTCRSSIQSAHYEYQDHRLLFRWGHADGRLEADGCKVLAVGRSLMVSVSGHASVAEGFRLRHHPRSSTIPGLDTRRENDRDR